MEVIIMYAKANLWDRVIDELVEAYSKGDQSVCFSIDHETGRTLLHLAVDYGNLEIVEDIVHWFGLFSKESVGTAVNCPDHLGQTPIDLSNDWEIKMFLQEIA